ncbi:uncharacterized protein METZ01_LOCUS37078 [marine metagenome]|uniref:50S ribosomal protein L3 n=1 Tax=marine metagenome TaxID=408172 RepID=A0A381QZ30_9ZZZZ
MRTGLICKKLGMSQIYSDEGSHVPVTILHLDECQVVSLKTEEKHGYSAIQVGVGKIKEKKLSKPLGGHYKKNNVEPKLKLTEFRVDPENIIDPGSELIASHFITGQLIDASGISIGKGFAGSMKRHNFSGLRASHGVSISHRSHGSTGQCQDPGKVFKGKKMAGHMGNSRVTTQNLEVVRVDPDEGYIFVKGSVPGPKGGWVILKDSVKSKLPENVPLPTAIKVNDKEDKPKEEKNDQLEKNELSEKSTDEGFKKEEVKEQAGDEVEGVEPNDS